MKHFSRIFITMVMAVVMASCSKEQFKVVGEIAGADGQVLFFEHQSLKGPVVLDSVKLDDEGLFAFSADKQEAPEFYRLRIGGQIINLSADSTETVTVKAKQPNMASNYEVEGSYNCSKIRELALKQQQLQAQVIDIQKRGGMSAQQFNDTVMALLNAYKQDVKLNYIFQEPDKAYSYFALFQTLGPYLIFSPSDNADDIKVFGAVATSWDTYYPGAERGQNLHNIAIEGMRNRRIVQNNAVLAERQIDSDKVQEAGLIDIQLPDSKGLNHSLSELKGKVVLLDFHVFAMDESPKRILSLRELYNKYQSQGLEIYQVSVDPDKHFWQQTSAALPWICVHDDDALNSRWLQVYFVGNVPDFFLIDRQSNIVKRADQITDVETEIKKLL